MNDWALSTNEADCPGEYDPDGDEGGFDDLIEGLVSAPRGSDPELQPLRDLATAMLIWAARDVREKVRSQATKRSAQLWLQKPYFNAKLNLALCCTILWGEAVCPRRVGQAILDNPYALAAIEIPSSGPLSEEEGVKKVAASKAQPKNNADPVEQLLLTLTGEPTQARNHASIRRDSIQATA